MTTFRHLSLTLMSTAALLGVAVSPAGAASKLKLGVYDCESYNYTSGGLDYNGSAKLESGHRYQFAFDRHGSTLKKPSSGTYSVSGTKVKFKGGGLGKSTGKIVQSTVGGSPHIALYTNGKSSGISCYYVKKP
jgi:hypothetical protein